MATSALLNAYVKLLKKLLPNGKVWENIKEITTKVPLFNGMAVEFCRVDERGKDLLEEMDPRTATELLPDWEQLLGLPDDCSGELGDLNQRRVQAGQKLAAVGGMTASFYEQKAASLGFNAVVRDYRSFRVGRSRVGEPLSNPFDPDRDVFRVGRNRVGEPLKRHGWRYCFEMNVDDSVVEPFRVGQNRVGQPLVKFGNELLECTIKKLKPAHTCVFFYF